MAGHLAPATRDAGAPMERARSEDIVQEGRNDAGEPTRWSFTDITADSFRWIGERSLDGGATWQRQAVFLARRAIVPMVGPMLDHVSIGVRDLSAAKRFYDATLHSLGYSCLSESIDSLGYGGSEISFWISPADRPVSPDEKSGLHFCFAAPSRDSVDAFHAAALRTDGKDKGRRGCVPATDHATMRHSSSIPTAIGSRPTTTVDGTSQRQQD